MLDEFKSIDESAIDAWVEDVKPGVIMLLQERPDETWCRATLAKALHVHENIVSRACDELAREGKIEQDVALAGHEDTVETVGAKIDEMVRRLEGALSIIQDELNVAVDVLNSLEECRKRLTHIEQWAFEFQDHGCVPCGRLIRETKPAIAMLNEILGEEGVLDG